MGGSGRGSGRGGGGWFGSGGCRNRGGGVSVDVNGEVKFCENSKKKICRGGGGGSDGFGDWGGSDQGLGWGGSKVWGRWLMWGMGNVNQE